MKKLVLALLPLLSGCLGNGLYEGDSSHSKGYFLRQHEKTCSKYGFIHGSAAFSKCVMNLDIQRQQQATRDQQEQEMARIRYQREQAARDRQEQETARMRQQQEQAARERQEQETARMRQQQEQAARIEEEKREEYERGQRTWDPRAGQLQSSPNDAN